MKHVKLFDEFMRDTVNLNQTRINTLTDHVDSIKTFLRKSDYSPKIVEFSEQGSWAHKTIIKPPGSKGFDADLVIFIEEVEDWEPKDYVNNLYQIFKDSGIYKDKVKKQTRCVKINYAGDFHLDVVPCIKREEIILPVFSNTYHVLNRLENEEEPTDPQAYTDWISGKNSTTGTNMLQKVTRLHKYQRDIKQTFSVKSILLTTLLGERVDILDDLFQKSEFSDLPTSLKTLTSRLDDWLQDRPNMPTVENPALDFDDEDFNRHWDQDKYANFREMFHKYREWIDDAYDEINQTESLRKWRKVFGDEFAKDEVREAAATVSKAVLFSEARDLDLVAAIKRGAVNLARFPFLPHAKKPTWKMVRQAQRISVKIYGYNHEYRDDSTGIAFSSGSPVPKNKELKFKATQKNGLPFPPKYTTYWQVVNSGEAAERMGQLRGEFNQGVNGIRWESTSYLGVHWVQAYVINNRNQCVGQSDRFFVVIE